MNGHTRKMILAILMAVAMMFSSFAVAEQPAGEVTETAETAEAVSEQPEEQPLSTEADGSEQEEVKNELLEQAKNMLRIIFGLTGNDPLSDRQWIADQVRKILKNPGQYTEDFWDALFGTGADGISMEGNSEKKGKIEFVMELPDPVAMPATYSVAYHRLNDEKREVVTLLERDADGNIHYLDGDDEQVFVRTEEGFRMYPVLKDHAGFGEWDGILLSARSVREKTEHFWNCADQTFIKWLGADRTEATEYLGRPCGLYHAEPGTITFTYKCDMVIDDETGICLCYTADELLKGAVYRITEDERIEIEIGDYDIGGDEMNFYCAGFETEDIAFPVPAV